MACALNTFPARARVSILFTELSTVGKVTLSALSSMIFALDVLFKKPFLTPESKIRS